MFINIVTTLNNVGKKTLGNAVFIWPEEVCSFFAVHIKPGKFSSPYFSHFKFHYISMNYEQKIDVFYSLFFIYISFLNVYLHILQHSIQNQVHIGTSRSCYNNQNDHMLHYGIPSNLKCKIIAL